MYAELRRLRPTLWALLMAACATPPEAPPPPPSQPAPAVNVETVTPAVAADLSVRAMLAHYRKVRDMSAGERARERSALQGRTGDPQDAMRLAILLGQERGELARALGLLDAIARSDKPQAQPLQGIARLFSDQFAERLKLEVQVERLGVSVREADRRAVQLQEKLDALANIERSLPGRPAPPMPDAERAR